MYLHTVLDRSNDEITKQVVLAQEENCYKGDFYEQVRSNMAELNVTDDEMEQSKEKLNEIVSRKMKDLAFQFLINKAKLHSKVNDSIYSNCDGAVHYKDPRFTPDLSNLLFKFRTRTFLVKNNFRNNYRNTNILCPLCEETDDTQEHLLNCGKLNDKYGKITTNKIEDIFSTDKDTLFSIAKTLKELTEIRKVMLDPDE